MSSRSSENAVGVLCDPSIEQPETMTDEQELIPTVLTPLSLPLLLASLFIPLRDALANR
jgi:hypothetical protein